ncbi:mannonate dehydratase-like [Saccostrea echinata]|uniref:mannonate dehydratase-like n=1 Tax=Saccostrea echinata TaxID=191078 RepID=UPI002A808C3D|nr:mannonate dehydratase-like [Saccostrea echinata]
MRMSFRWFGPEDPVTLSRIRQIPGVESVVASLFHIPVGEAWPQADIAALKRQITDAGLKLEVIESLNIHEDIKAGSAARRDEYIENYQLTLRRLAAAGVETVCYNFMPVFDWTRTSLHHRLADDSSTMFFDGAALSRMSPDELFARVRSESGGVELPGWEAERLRELRVCFERYAGLGTEGLWQNLAYFLSAVIPVCEEVGINMAIHPDDPPWPIFALPRIITGAENLERFLGLYESPRNGLTLCAGSLGANQQHSIPGFIRHFGSRIHFGHVRNLKHEGNGVFYESAHLSSCGSLDLFAIMKAYHEIGYTGHIRPDHGRMIWGEQGRAGYGLYDRALGASYLLGLWEAINKMSR